MQKLKAEQENIIQNAVSKQAREYMLQAEHYKAEMQKAQQEAEGAEKFAILGKQVFDLSAQNAEQLGDITLAQFAGSNEAQEILSKLSRVDKQLNSLSLMFDQVKAQPGIESHSSANNSVKVILGIIAGILFFVSVVGWGLYLLDDSAEQAAKAKRELQQQQDQVNKLNAEIADLQKQKSNLQEQLNSSENKPVEKLEKKDVSNKKKEER